MAANNFEKSLALVLEHEGGYINHPRDPGGATNKGVTQAVYDAYRKTKSQSKRSVKFLTPDELRAIYKFQYWDMIRGDNLPRGVDYAVFDFAVNSGVAKASKYLQAVVGVPKDGIIGARTIAAISNRARVINDLCDRRMGFLRDLKILFATFGRGWTRRVNSVRAMALVMAA
jgi:lysozyme family protein